MTARPVKIRLHSWLSSLANGSIVWVAHIAPRRPAEFLALVEQIIKETGINIQISDDRTYLKKYYPYMVNFVKNREILKELIQKFDLNEKEIKVYKIPKNDNGQI